MEIWCDSSFDDKNKIAGIGIIRRHNGVDKKPVSFYRQAPNNNYGELWGCYIAAIMGGGSKCTIYTDSQVALDYINGRRGKEYEDKHKSSWTREQYHNHKMMQVLAYQVRKVSKNNSFVWIKGHRKFYQIECQSNGLADYYAKMGRAKFYKENRR